MKIHKKIIYDEKGRPAEIIIPWKEYKKIEELLGLDLEEEVKQHLKKAKKERKDPSAYVNLEEI